VQRVRIEYVAIVADVFCLQNFLHMTLVVVRFVFGFTLVVFSIMLLFYVFLFFFFQIEFILRCRLVVTVLSML